MQDMKNKNYNNMTKKSKENSLVVPQQEFDSTEYINFINLYYSNNRFLKVQTRFMAWRDGLYAYPGGFELRLFQAFAHADMRNAYKLFNAFPIYFAEEFKPF